ncbi:MAG: hypothetical protein J6W17_01280 [Campylobacter sp.]|nr:hypothetical protein [Campylobacter sp.]
MGKIDKLVINIFGAPGVGKSTLARKLEKFMQEKGFYPFLVEEFATYLIKNGKTDKLKDQTYVTFFQSKLIQKGFEWSNLLITDSPIDLGEIYNQDPKLDYTVKAMIDECKSHYTSVNLFLRHEVVTRAGYSMDTRVHTFEESLKIQDQIVEKFQDKLILIDRDAPLENILQIIKNSVEFKEFYRYWGEVIENRIKASKD